MFRFIYKTTNTLNGMYYIGMHRTDDMDDGYLGSGVAFMKAISLFGRSVFTREVLHFAESDYELRCLEKQYVPRSVVDDPLCYNLTTGGAGRVCFGEPCNLTEEGRERLRISGKRYIGENNPFYGKTHNQKTLDILSKKQRGKVGELNPFYGKTHTEETKRKASARMMGKNKTNTLSITFASWKKSTGWWCTPSGCFISSKEAAASTGIGLNSIKSWCKQADEVVKKNYQVPEIYHGRTWRENGFYFVPKKA